MLNYLHLYGACSNPQIPVAQLAKTLRIDKDTARQNLAELCAAGLVDIASLATSKRGRPKQVCSLSEQFKKDLQQSCKIPDHAAKLLEALGLHDHHKRTGAFGNKLQLSKGQSLLLGALIARSEVSGLVYNVSHKALSELTGETAVTIKLYLKKLKTSGFITKLWAGMNDKYLVGKRIAAYQIHFCILISNPEEKTYPISSNITCNLESIPKLAVLEPSERVKILSYDFDSCAQKFYSTEKDRYLERLEHFAKNIPEPSCNVRLFIYWQTANLISALVREHWHEINSKERMSIQTVDKLAGKYLEQISQIFIGNAVQNYRQVEAGLSSSEPSKDEADLCCSLQDKYRQLSDVVSAYCFFLFFDSLRLAKELAHFLELNIPNLDYKTVLFHGSLFTKPIFEITGIMIQSAPPSELSK